MISSNNLTFHESPLMYFEMYNKTVQYDTRINSVQYYCYFNRISCSTTSLQFDRLLEVGQSGERSRVTFTHRFPGFARDSVIFDFSDRASDPEKCSHDATYAIHDALQYTRRHTICWPDRLVQLTTQPQGTFIKLIIWRLSVKLLNAAICRSYTYNKSSNNNGGIGYSHDYRAVGAVLKYSTRISCYASEQSLFRPTTRDHTSHSASKFILRSHFFAGCHQTIDIRCVWLADSLESFGFELISN